MEQTQSFNEKQRAAFARLIEEAKKREAAELEPESDIDDRVEAVVLPQLAKARGATKLIAKIRKLSKDLAKAEKALGDLGFSCDDESISLKYNAPKQLEEALVKAKRSARKEREAAFKKYDRAILDVWAAEDTRTAMQVVEGVL